MFELFQLDFMLQALVFALITGVLLSYLGVHVVNRGIVFVDLALGQISMLGVAVATLIGFGLTIVPLIFTLLGAILLSLINVRDKRLKREAIIGIIYAVASAFTVLLISKTPHGDSDIQEVLFGNILTASVAQIKLTGIIFGVLMVIHVVFYKRFLALTFSLSEDDDHGSARLSIWNFLFFITIGLAIVFSVKLNGVILVFSYLIIPSVCGIMLAKKTKSVVVISILISILGSFLGLYFSFHFDFPAGSSIVASLGAIFALSSILSITKGKLIN